MSTNNRNKALPLNLPCMEPDASGTVSFSMGDFFRESEEARADCEAHPEYYRMVTMGDLLKEARAKDRAAKKREVTNG